MNEVILENFGCDLYIDSEDDLNTLLQNIATIFNTNPIEDGIFVNEGSLFLLKNKNFHKIYKKNLEDGFLFYRYLLKAKPNDLMGKENAIQFIAPILKYLWSKGFPAIAFCDYEENLPYKGGYKNPFVPLPL
jgi:hypothetical protein